MNTWRNIWNEKQIEYPVVEIDEKQLFLKMKEANGFDIVDGAFTYDAFLKQFEELQNEINYYENKTGGKISTLFEVGCGNGANLLLTSKMGYKSSGLDYSKSLVDGGNKILEKYGVKLEYGNADELDVKNKYDVILSNGVFAYFKDLEYAEKVLEKMLSKANCMIALIDIHDKDKECSYYEFRRELIPNFDELYKDLPKLFYPKVFFEDFARKNELQIKFVKTEIKEYWNNEFIYSCYMYK
ncbi:class I SAM-dependent methyltransferase [Lysinibacillus sp. NPDC058147]|uniref:class I SAM-dependent methyltransferase n=1 Tax=unclassified Lysinibacillus TaxID=2636778 RepID=UPI0036DF3749